MLRPTLSLLVAFAITTLPIAIWMSGTKWYYLPKFKKALGLSLANFLAPLNIRKDFYDSQFLIDLPAWLKVLSGFQSVAGLFFAFLIALALRNRFRLR